MKKKIENLFKKYPGRSFKSKEIARRLNIKNTEDYSVLKSDLHKLYKEEFIVRKGKRYQLNLFPEKNKLQGVLRLHPDGYGFVIPKKKKFGDIYISERNIGTAFNGDKVEVVLFAKQKGKNLEGQIIKVLERGRKEFIGTLRRSKSFYFITPDDMNIHRDIYIDKENLNKAKEGDKVIVGNVEWDTTMPNPEGEVIEILGREGTADAENASIARKFNLKVKFPQKVLKEAGKFSKSIQLSEIKKRKDFREEIIFTIDPVDAKDFDDALSVSKLENGNFSVGVHIADVSHYVTKDSVLDKQAAIRGNSVYLVGAVIPMLPEELSNVICSLVPGEDRLTFSVIFELTPKGKVVKYEIEKSVINSKRRFTYDEVQQIIESGKGDFKKEITWLNKLAKTLRKNRVREGSIEFFTPEVVFELDKEGKPVAVHKNEIKESNMLVEEFMLLANRTVALHFSGNGRAARPFVYRIHDKPDAEKMIEFARFVKSLGYSFKPNSFSDSRAIQRLIVQVRGSEEEAVINELAIRSMAKAIYSPKNIGHFGLGFKYYTHFTSPIRRYSDLLVHRLVEFYTQNKGGIYYSFEQLNKICEYISTTERNAVDAERLSVKMKQVDFLSNRLGDEFHAVVSGVTHYGIFVELTDILAEGLIRVRDLENDFYVYDEKKYSLIGRHTKKNYRLGDKLVVKLVRVDLDKLELDFITVD
ncbi:ribonuclease R [bacterium BMS3Abin03]|nr:ribonuclease R [bacterium BMS3Abin03]